MDANTLGQQLQEYQTKLSQYGSELPGQIKEEVRKAWSPTLQEASGVVGQQLQGFLPKYFGMAEQLGGTTAADISPTARLKQMGNYLGELGGGLSTASNYADYMGANMQSAYQDALNAMQMGQQGLQQQYQNTFGQYQLAKQLEEAEKQRQLQMQLASMSGGGEGAFNIPDEPVPPDYQPAMTELAKINISGQNQYLSGTKRKQLADAIISKYPGIDLYEAYRIAGFSDKYNPGLPNIKNWWSTSSAGNPSGSGKGLGFYEKGGYLG